MKKTIKKTLSGLFVFIFLTASSAFAQQNLTKVKQHLKKIIEEEYLLGVSAAYIQPEGEVQYFSLGSIAEGKEKRPTKHTIYEIGSISKTFTSLILARMVQQGIVSLHTPIGNILPDTLELPTFEGKKINLLNLATHTSGLPRLPTNFKPENWMNPYADYTVPQMYTFLENYELTRAPGGRLVYSNFGAGLLGYLMALKSEMTYKDLLRKYVTEPLGMNDTQIEVPAQKQDRFAAPYNYGIEVKRWDMSVLAGAGGIRSTTKDLVAYLKAQMRPDAAPMQEAINMTHVVRFGEGNDSTATIGLGWFYSTKHDTLIWHNGGTGGYRSFVGWNAETKVGAVVLVSGKRDVTNIGFNLLDKRYELNEMKESVKVDSTILASYTGYYQITPAFGLKIFMKNHFLVAQAIGQQPFRLFAESKNRFFYRAVDAKIEFIKNNQDEVHKLKLYQNGRTLTGIKMK